MTDMRLGWAVEKANVTETSEPEGLRLGWAIGALKKQDKITKDRETRERAEARVATERAGQTNLPSDLAWQFARGTLPGAYLDEGAALLSSTVKGTPYDEELAYQRAANRAMDRESPVLTTLPGIGDVTVGGAAKLAGGVAGGLGTYGAARGLGGAAARFVAPGSTPLRTAGKLAAGGTTSGAIYGYGEGEGERNRAANAALGAGIGAVAGPAAYAAGAGLARGYQGARNLMFGTRDEALRPYVPSAVSRVRTELALDDASGVAGRNQNAGSRGMLLETGENLQGYAQGVATKPGPGKSIVTDALYKRRETSEGVLEGAVNKSLQQGEDIAATLARLRDEASSDANPFYKSFRETKLNISQGTQNLVERIEKAFPGISEQIRHNVANDPDLDPAVLQNGGHFLDQLRQALSYAGYKKELQGLGALSRGQVKNARAYARRLNDAIDAEVKRAGNPGVYKNARSAVEAIKDFESGVDAGKNILSKADATPAYISGLIKSSKTPQYAEGIRASIREQIRRDMAQASSVYGQDAADALGVSKALKRLSSKEVRGKLRAAGFKEPEIKDLAKLADEEGQYLGTYGRIIGGSQTSERLAAQKRVPDPPNLAADAASLRSTTTTGLTASGAQLAFAKTFQGEFDQRFARESTDIAKMLVSQGADRDAILSALRSMTARMARDDAQKRAAARVVARVARSLDDRALEKSDRTGQFSPNRMLGN